MKRALLLALVAFVAIEIALVRWAVQTQTLERALAQFREPVTLIMLVDFSFFAGIVWVGMVLEERKRGRNGFIWLPGIIIAPTIALIAFLLQRRPPETRD